MIENIFLLWPAIWSYLSFKTNQSSFRCIYGTHDRLQIHSKPILTATFGQNHWKCCCGQLILRKRDARDMKIEQWESTRIGFKWKIQCSSSVTNRNEIDHENSLFQPTASTILLNRTKSTLLSLYLHRVSSDFKSELIFGVALTFSFR